jgi:hypothetical protein
MNTVTAQWLRIFELIGLGIRVEFKTHAVFEL